MSRLMRVAYDGTDFSGWARQPRGLRTVQGELEIALAELFTERIWIRGASRTDAGVHAHGQLAAFDVSEGVGGPPTDRLAHALSGVLPPAISVWRVWDETRPDGSPAQPRFDNGGKHYCYRIRPHAPVPEPSTRAYEWRIRRALDVDAMVAAAPQFIGTKDFSSFRAAGCQASSPERRLTSVELRTVMEPTATAGGQPRPVLEVHVRGEAFLMHMVRIMVGTLVEIGSGRLSADALADLFTRPDRRRAGPTAPAHGLTLTEVVWPGTVRPRTD